MRKLALALFLLLAAQSYGVYGAWQAQRVVYDCTAEVGPLCYAWEPSAIGKVLGSLPHQQSDIRIGAVQAEVADAAELGRAQQVADAVRPRVGRADPPRPGARRPALPVRLRLQVERPELVKADDHAGIAGRRRRTPSAIAYSSRIRFFFCSNAGSFDRFHVLTA